MRAVQCKLGRYGSFTCLEHEKPEWECEGREWEGEGMWRVDSACVAVANSDPKAAPAYMLHPVSTFNDPIVYKC